MARKAKPVFSSDTEEKETEPIPRYLRIQFPAPFVAQCVFLISGWIVSNTLFSSPLSYQLNFHQVYDRPGHRQSPCLHSDFCIGNKKRRMKWRQF